MGSHIMVLWLWLIIALSSTVCGHSGYEFPWSPMAPAQVHDYHHESFRSNYGSIGLLDWVHGTDELFWQHIDKKSEGKKDDVEMTSESYTGDDESSASSKPSTIAKQD
jgi:sterol desaturase/sphingolipid hydroxylase (fatty acid hydroxylase superfamily)